MKAKPAFYFFSFILILAVTFSFNVQGGLQSYINQTGYAYVFSSEFNDTSGTVTADFGSLGHDISKGFYLPKNATMQWATASVSGGSGGVTNQQLGTTEPRMMTATSDKTNNKVAVLWADTTGDILYFVEHDGTSFSSQTDTGLISTTAYADDDEEGTSIDAEYDSNGVLHVCYKGDGNLNYANYTSTQGWDNTVLSTALSQCAIAINSTDHPSILANATIFTLNAGTVNSEIIIGGTPGSNEALDFNSTDGYIVSITNLTKESRLHRYIYTKTLSGWEMLQEVESTTSLGQNSEMLISGDNIWWITGDATGVDFYNISNSTNNGETFVEQTTIAADVLNPPKVGLDFNSTGDPRFCFHSSDISLLGFRRYGGGNFNNDDITTSANNHNYACDVASPSDSVDYVFYGSLASNNVYYSSFTGEPNNVTLGINDDIFFFNENALTSAVLTSDFSSNIQNFLDGCTPDGRGYCDVPLNITSNTSGSVTVDSIVLNYTINASPYIQVIDWYNQTNGTRHGVESGVLKKYKFEGNPDTNFNITGFFINATASQCQINGVTGTVSSIAGFQYCNLSNFEYVNFSDSTWSLNHTVFDATLGIANSTNQTNSSQVFNLTHRLFYSNTTTLYPNRSQSSSDDVFYNVTVELTLDDSELHSELEQGVNYFDGTNSFNVNVSNLCVNTLSQDETNYSNVTINNQLWLGCYNDTDTDGIKDYFKVVVPESTQTQLHAWGEEDIVFPNVTINAPSGTYTESTVDINFSVRDEISLFNCWYNITNDVFEQEKASTAFTCGEFNSTTSIGGGNDGYIIYVYGNDTSGNINETERTFSLNVEAQDGGAAAGGGGGKSTTVEVPIETIVELPFVGCGDLICQENENPATCLQDCPVNVDNLVECIFTGDRCAYQEAWFTQLLIVGLISGAVFITYQQTQGKQNGGRKR